MKAIFTTLTDDVTKRIILQLSRKQLSLLTLVHEGLKYREMTSIVHTSEQTIKNHLRFVFDATGMDTKLELALFIERHPELLAVSKKLLDEELALDKTPITQIQQDVDKVVV